MIDKIALLVSHGLLLALFVLLYPLPELDTEDPQDIAKLRPRWLKKRTSPDA